jgi:hypothetical protein
MVAPPRVTSSSCRSDRRFSRFLRLGLPLIFFGLGLGGQAAAQRLEQKPASSMRGFGPGKHCLNEQKQKILLNHYLAGSINPLGIGNSMRLSLCTPLITKPGILFDLTNVDFGLLLLTSPTDVTGGAFVNITPISILVLRAEISGFGIWPIPLQGAGFISLNSQNDFTLNSLSPSPFGENPARHASGGKFLVGATLRGEVPLGRFLSIAVANSFNAEYWRLTSGTWDPAAAEGREYFVSARRDVALRGPGDLVLANTAALVFGINPHRNVVLRVGVTDDLVYVPSHGYLGNIAAGLFAVSVKNLRNLAKDGSFFLRVGTFTHHAFRGGITFALGFDVTYEILKRAHPRPPAVDPPPPELPPQPVVPLATDLAAAPPPAPAPPSGDSQPPTPVAPATSSNPGSSPGPNR